MKHKTFDRVLKLMDGKGIPLYNLFTSPWFDIFLFRRGICRFKNLSTTWKKIR
jgi:hypothetical protein